MTALDELQVLTDKIPHTAGACGCCNKFPRSLWLLDAGCGNALYCQPCIAERISLLAAVRVIRKGSTLWTEDEADAWMAEVRAWGASHPQRNHVAGDSREDIYGDRC